MSLEPTITLKTLGYVFLASIFIPAIVMFIYSRGDFGGFQATIKGIDGVGHSADFIRRMFGLGTLSQVIGIVGFGMLTVLLRNSGEVHIATLAFILLLISQVFLFFQGTFHSSVTVWASKELADTGSVPDMFQPLWKWMYSTVQMTYVYFGLLASAGYGWSILNTSLLPPWLGWFLIGWSGIWITFFLIAGDNLPLVLWVAPLLIGIVALAV